MCVCVRARELPLELPVVCSHKCTTPVCLSDSTTFLICTLIDSYFEVVAYCKSLDGVDMSYFEQDVHRSSELPQPICTRPFKTVEATGCLKVQVRSDTRSKHSSLILLLLRITPALSLQGSSLF